MLLNLEDPDVLLKVARRAVAEDWSVDKLEKFVLFDPSMASWLLNKIRLVLGFMQGTRFRHMAQFRRWRTDKKPSDCTYAQLEVVPAQELMEVFAGGR